MPDVTSEELEKLARHQRLQNAMELVLGKLKRDAKTITTEDVDSLAHDTEEGDVFTADIIAAVNDLAVRNEEERLTSGNSSSSTAQLSQVVSDLHSTVKANPGEVNIEILRTTQRILSLMQKAIGHTNTPHPELEAELQQEYAKIVPKVERGVVTKAEADHLHSLEARAHGHTERGGFTAAAQSVAKRDRQPSISNTSSCERSRNNSRAFTPPTQSHDDAYSGSLKKAMEPAKAMIEPVETKSARHKEQRSPAKVPEKSGGMSPNSSMRRFHSLSDSTNATRDDSRYDVAFPKLRKYSSANTGTGTENTSSNRKPEDSHLIE